MGRAGSSLARMTMDWRTRRAVAAIRSSADTAQGKLFFAICFLAKCWLILLPAYGAGVNPSRAQAEALTIMVDAYFPDDPVPEWGSGIIVAQRGSTLYAITAAHVIWRGSVAAQSIRVRLKWLNEQIGPESVAVIKRRGDLSVLQITLSPVATPSADTLLFAALGSSKDLHQGDGVRSMGHGRGEAWSTCLDPDVFARMQDDFVVFDSRCVQPGHSGGPLLNENDRIIGMIRVDQQPVGTAESIDSVLSTVKDLGVPVDLVTMNAPEANTFRSLSVGNGVACGVTTSGRVYCWGSNKGYALGAGTERDFKADVGLPLADRHRFTDVSAGDHDACALTLTGLALCWGDFFPDGPKATPVQVPSSQRFQRISKGPSHACAIAMDGTAYCWGKNQWGQLGDGTTTDRYEPRPVKGDIKWSEIATGINTSCAISTSQDVYCWGENLNHLAPLPDEKVLEPVPAFSSPHMQKIVIGGEPDIGGDGNTKFACGVAVEGQLYCWGGAVSRRFPFPGNSSNGSKPADPSQPVQMSESLKFTSVGAGKFGACGVTSDHQVMCWGDNLYGELGPDDSRQAESKIPKLNDAQAVYMGEMASCALLSSGKAVCWGHVYDGDLGIGGSPDLWGSQFPPLFPVLVSQCGSTLLGDVPRSVQNVRQLDVSFLKSRFKDGGFVDEHFNSALNRVIAAIQIVRGKIRSCDADPSVKDDLAILETLNSIEKEVDRLSDPLRLPLPPFNPSRAKMKEFEQERAALIAKSKQEFGAIAPKYVEAAAGLRLAR
jgi:alpha-tubulin suppressor-like RCC1 family protein/S1-C subfamily serine protease